MKYALIALLFLSVAASAQVTGKIKFPGVNGAEYSVTFWNAADTTAVPSRNALNWKIDSLAVIIATKGTSNFSGSYDALTGKPSLFDGAWSSITGKPATYTPATHSHAISDITNLQSSLDAKGTSNFDGAYSSLSGKPDLTLKVNVIDTVGKWAAAVHTHTAASLGLGNVTNESKATMHTNATFTGTFNVADGSIASADLANAAVANLSGTNTGDNAVNSLYSGLVSNANHTGDATGSTALILATVNSNVGSFGSATQVGTFTVNAKGLVTAASNTSIAIAESQVTNLVSDLAAKQATLVSATNIKTINGSSVLGSGDLVVNGAGLGYTLSVQALTSSPTDAQTIYFGNLPKAPVTGAGTSKIYIRKAGTIKIAEIYCYSGTAGSNEAWPISIRLNNSTDTQIASLSVSTNERVWSNTGLSIAVAVGDYIEIKSVNPTWGTNPLTTIFGGYIYIE